jgi:nicotinate-nucleotide pyrophosphorylase (carboxylating)
MIFHYIDPNLTIDTFIADGMPVKYGDVVFHVSGSAKSILKRKEWF